MIVLVQRNGQLGNRLAYLKAFLAIAMEYRLELVNLTFDEYARFFNGSAGNLGFFFPEHPARHLPRWLARLLRRGLSAMEPTVRSYGKRVGLTAAAATPKGEFLFLDGELAARAQRQALVFYAGWPVVPPDILRRHAGRIRQYFSPVEALADRVAECLGAARQGCDLLVGIHIRQGDYRDWHGGKHFFTTEEYAGMMRLVVDKHAGRRVRFVVCSNVPQDRALFRGLDVLPGPGGTVEDLYLLAGCDEIYGPQSSYSGWAAFYGGKPLYWMAGRNPGEFVSPDITC